MTQQGSSAVFPAAPPPSAPVREGATRRLYHWTLSLAERPSAPWALGVIAFAESSFFPLPPDIILIPMSLARPKRAWLYALICTLGSVAGALLGYAIGELLYKTVGQWLIHLYGYETKMEVVTASFQKWGAFAIILKGFLPIPFKLVTIMSGIFRFNLPLFVLVCLLTRGARFFAAAVLIRRYDEPIKRLLERYFGVFMLSLVVVVIAGFYLAAKIV